MPEHTVRPIHPDDLPDVLQMVQALAEHHGDTPAVTLDSLRRDALGSDPWLRILVAEAEGKLIGYAALCPLAQLQFGTRGMDMHHLFVREAMRGQGVGRALIDTAIKTSRDLNCVFLGVGTHPDNKAAAQTYLAMGFERRPTGGPRFGMWL